MDLEKLKVQFKENKPLYARLKDEATFILEPLLKEEGIKVHSLDSRVKDVGSFLNKVKRKKSKKPFEEIEDIVGVRVVCLFLSDISRIGEVIKNSFEVLSEDNKIEGHEASSFEYLSVHFIVSLDKECSGPRYDKIVEIPFEIQVRTIAMHAWATISHYLDYKTELDVPKDLRRDFYALSGLFYVADTHFEIFFKSSQESMEKMVKAFEIDDPDLDQEINLHSLTAYLKKRFHDREHADTQTISELINELLETGYKSINEIDKAVSIAWDAFIIQEEEKPPLDEDTGKRTKYVDVGVIRTIFCLLDDEFYKMRGMEINIDKYKKLIKEK